MVGCEYLMPKERACKYMYDELWVSGATPFPEFPINKSQLVIISTLPCTFHDPIDFSGNVSRSNCNGSQLILQYILHVNYVLL